MSSQPDDVAEIRRLHRQWWSSNVGLDVPTMQECFAPQYLMWNLNSHPYFSLKEKSELFAYYKAHMVPTQPPELWDIRVTADGDMGYLTAEGILPVEVSGSGSGSAIMDCAAPLYEQRGDVIRFRFRETSVYRRDDGHGNPVWKMWHFHASPLAPVDEPRPGFGDTAADRGHGPVEVMDD
jgi:ketosteroid isomerase-like protein